MMELDMWFFINTAMFVVCVLLNGGFCMGVLCQVKYTSPLVILLLNILCTNALDATLLYAGRFIALEFGPENYTLAFRLPQHWLPHWELEVVRHECTLDKMWYTVHVALYLAVTLHAVWNLAGVCLCFYLANLFRHGRHIMFKGMDRSTARSFAGITWLLSIVLLLNPLMVLCFDNMLALYFLLAVIGIGVILVWILCIAAVHGVCCNACEGPTIRHGSGDISRTAGPSVFIGDVCIILLDVIILTVTMLPPALLGILEMQHVSHYILPDVVWSSPYVSMIFSHCVDLVPHAHFLLQPILLTFFLRAVRTQLSNTPPGDVPGGTMGTYVKYGTGPKETVVEDRVSAV